MTCGFLPMSSHVVVFTFYCSENWDIHLLTLHFPVWGGLESGRANMLLLCSFLWMVDGNKVFLLLRKYTKNFIRLASSGGRKIFLLLRKQAKTLTKLTSLQFAVFDWNGHSVEKYQGTATPLAHAYDPSYSGG